MGYLKGAVGGLIALIVLFVAGCFSGVSAQQQPACASQLIPCAQYLSSTSPPASCCDPLREALNQDVDCLCNLYRDPDLFRSFGINITQALQLPQHCNIPSDLDLNRCNVGALPPGTNPPPATPGNNDGSGASRVGWFGISCLTCLLLFWASIMV